MAGVSVVNGSHEQPYNNLFYLKNNLLQPPILSYPQFDLTAKQFVVYTDTSNVGLRAVLEQNNCVIAYSSLTLTKLERNYSVIQKECLAIVYAIKQFQHYLLGSQFQIQTDHAPLQWLSAHQIKGLLGNFIIVHRKGILNANADSLSRHDHKGITVPRLGMSIGNSYMCIKVSRSWLNIFSQSRWSLLCTYQPHHNQLIVVVSKND